MAKISLVEKCDMQNCGAKEILQKWARILFE